MNLNEIIRLRNRGEEMHCDIVRWRRALHSIPELRMETPKTETLIIDFLREIGVTDIRSHVGGHGVCAVIKGELPGKCLAIRADCDGLPIKEETGLPFASTNGNMHACGHDGHAASGLGVAAVLMQIKEHLRGTIKLIFQPAEEGVRGAKSIVENGHLDGVDFCIGSHVSDLRKDDADVAVSPGSHGSLATTKYDVYFHGVSAHAGGSPEKGKNVMLAVATAIMNLYAIPRHSGGMTRINVGTVNAGSGRNVIADVAKMEIELRGETTEINDYVVAYATNVIEAAAKMHGCTYEMKVMGGAQSMTSDKAMIDRIRAAAEAVGLKVSKDDSNRSGGSEDFSYMMTRVQEQGGIATFMRVHSKQSAPGHNRRFDIDEVAITNAVKTFCATVYDIVK